ncbi:MAG: MBL fold metallo-hydrolase [Clostridia bacterium]|nr:MBL fold metallo-hydrolase [Clostridia bacterium]
MKITFIGTSHGVPAADRYCSSTMIEAGDAIYFIDAGAPLIDELLRLGKDVTRVRAVFATHCHSDHVCGLFSLASLVNWKYKDTAVSFYLPEERNVEAFKELIRSTDRSIDEERVRFCHYGADFSYEDENISLSVIPTKHMEKQGRPSFALLVTEKQSGKRALFTGDLSSNLARGDFPAIALEEELDVLICELAHFFIEHVDPYLKKCKAKAVYFHHVGPMKFEGLRAAVNNYSFPVHIPEDRDEITL